MTRLALFFSFAMAMLLIASAYAADPQAQQDANLAPATCDSLSDFFVTSCPLTWYGVTLYGTIDMGVTWENHGTPFNGRSPPGIEYLLSKNGNGSGFNRAPNAKLDAYAGVMYQTASAGLASGFLHHDTVDPTVGFRFRF
jgi:hypothetical protein